MVKVFEIFAGIFCSTSHALLAKLTTSVTAVPSWSLESKRNGTVSWTLPLHSSENRSCFDFWILCTLVTVSKNDILFVSFCLIAPRPVCVFKTSSRDKETNERWQTRTQLEGTKQGIVSGTEEAESKKERIQILSAIKETRYPCRASLDV